MNGGHASKPQSKQPETLPNGKPQGPAAQSAAISTPTEAKHKEQQPVSEQEPPASQQDAQPNGQAEAAADESEEAGEASR
jgi:hypothetical protein